jgi:glycerol uptake facilitator-like aquaporin
VATALLLFLVVTMVRWFIGPGSPVRIADIHLALAVIGPLSGLLLVMLILSPFGRRSGGHMNPAVTIALWLMDVFPGASVIPYVVAQLAGSMTGAFLGRVVWGSAVSSPSVAFAAVRPDPGWGGAAVFNAECGVFIAITLLVGHFLAHPRYSRWLPAAIGVAIAVLIVTLGPLSGGSANPARQFGPALLAGQTGLLWIYLIAPVTGAVLGAGVHHLLFRRFQIREPLTYRLNGVHTAASRAGARPSDRANAS